MEPNEIFELIVKAYERLQVRTGTTRGFERSRRATSSCKARDAASRDRQRGVGEQAETGWRPGERSASADDAG
jgi:hypothetical protein